MRVILYAHKKFLIHVNRAEKDGVLVSQVADIPIKKGELFGTDQLGNVEPLTDEYFERNFVPVVKIDKGSMAEGYIAMGRINLEEANASVHTYNDGLNELEESNEVLKDINKLYK